VAGKPGEASASPPVRAPGEVPHDHRHVGKMPTSGYCARRAQKTLIWIIPVKTSRCDKPTCLSPSLDYALGRPIFRIRESFLAAGRDKEKPPESKPGRQVKEILILTLTIARPGGCPCQSVLLPAVVIPWASSQRSIAAFAMTRLSYLSLKTGG
jgi:hypothetical protein